MAAWSQLPQELLGCILVRLNFVDHLRVAAVCVPWCSAVKSKFYSPLPQSPWLMLPTESHKDGDNDKEEDQEDQRTVDFYSLSENRVYKIPQTEPAICSRMWIGSSEGWLITADERSELHLLNPLTGAQFELPSVTTLSPLITAEFDSDGCLTGYRVSIFGPYKSFTPDELRHFLYVKATVVWTPPAASTSSSSSSSTTACCGYTVMLIYNPAGRVAFAKSGDKAWTSIHNQQYGFFDDIIHDNGFFFTLKTEAVEFWDLSGPSPKATLIKHDESIRSRLDIFGCIIIYLAKSSHGLLQVWRRGKRAGLDSDECTTDSFKVFKMDDDLDKWVELEDLGNQALFLGFNESLCLSNFPEVRENCIYFTGNYLGRQCVYQLTDSGVFDLGDGSIIPLYPRDSPLNGPLPIWITPKLS